MVAVVLGHLVDSVVAEAVWAAMLVAMRLVAVVAIVEAMVVASSAIFPFRPEHCSSIAFRVDSFSLQFHFEFASRTLWLVCLLKETQFVLEMSK